MQKIKTILGKPFFETKDCLIYCADATDLLPKLREQIHLTVTSPPYNIGKEYEKVMPLSEYVEWTKSWTQQVHNATTPSGAFWLNIGYVGVPGQAKALPLSYLLWSKIPFYLIQEIVWNYGAGVAGRTFFSPRNEKFLWFVKDETDYTFNLDAVRDPNVKYPNQKKNGKLKCNPLGKNPTDVWQIPKVTSGTNRSSKERTPHPAQFPIALIDRVVKASSNSGDLVLDPFLGSGSAAIAALQNGRKFVGIEMRKDYCELAAQRLTAYNRQPSLSAG